MPKQQLHVCHMSLGTRPPVSCIKAGRASLEARWQLMMHTPCTGAQVSWWNINKCFTWKAPSVSTQQIVYVAVVHVAQQWGYPIWKWMCVYLISTVSVIILKQSIMLKVWLKSWNTVLILWSSRKFMLYIHVHVLIHVVVIRGGKPEKFNSSYVPYIEWPIKAVDHTVVQSTESVSL